MRGLDRVLTRGLLRLLVLAAPVYVVLSALNGRRDRFLSWVDEYATYGGDPVDPLTAGRALPGTRLELVSHPVYSIADPPVWLWLLSLLPGLLLMLTTSAVALLLLRMMTETYDGRPFGSAAAPRLRRVALLIAMASFAVPISTAIYQHVFVSRVVPADAPGPIQSWNYLATTIPWLAMSLLVLCVAQAFAVGTRLADDVEGLV